MRPRPPTSYTTPSPEPRRAIPAVLVAFCAALLGCGDDTPATPGPTGGSGGSGGAGGAGGGTVPCPLGQAPSFSNECVPVGIQDCAEEFIEDDGLCHPRMDKSQYRRSRGNSLILSHYHEIISSSWYSAASDLYAENISDWPGYRSTRL